MIATSNLYILTEKETQILTFPLSYLDPKKCNMFLSKVSLAEIGIFNEIFPKDALIRDPR